jgi:hypothetical protein
MSTSIASDKRDEAQPERAPLKLPRAETAAAQASVTAAAPVPSAAEPAAEDSGRNPMFDLLVRDEKDMAGLLAYALYKQNKRDWLIAFQAAQGRPPTEAEMQAFILGERIARRTATYRQLAEEMLGQGAAAKPGQRESMRAPAAALMQTPANDAARSAAQPMQRQTLPWKQIGLLLLALVAMAVVFRLLGTWLFR